MPETTVYLLRHAQSAHDAVLPESLWPLTVAGRRQAEALIPLLKTLGIDQVFSSPYPRAQDTARPFAMAAGLPITPVYDLRERLLSDKPLDDFLDVLQKSWQDFDFALPKAESSAACQRRIVAAVDALASQHPGQTLLLASHGNAIGLFLNRLDGDFGFEQWRALRNPDLFCVRYGDDGPRWDRDFTFTPSA